MREYLDVLVRPALLECLVFYCGTDFTERQILINSLYKQYGQDRFSISASPIYACYFSLEEIYNEVCWANHYITRNFCGIPAVARYHDRVCMIELKKRSFPLETVAILLW